MGIHLYIVYDSFHVLTAGLNTCNKGRMGHKDECIYYMIFYRKICQPLFCMVIVKQNDSFGNANIIKHKYL